MRRAIYIGVLMSIITVGLGMGSKASAQTYNHTITVYATVAEQRAVYVDESGLIFKVAGNTANNITPQVFTADNKPLEMNDNILSQYQRFLAQHNNHLEAGVTYKVNPVAVQTAGDSRTIQIDSAGLTLGAARND